MSVTTEMPEAHCPNCGALFTAATCVFAEKRPAPGDITLCVCCGEILRFEEGLTIRNLLPVEYAAIHPDTKAEIERVLRAHALLPLRSATDAPET